MAWVGLSAILLCTARADLRSLLYPAEPDVMANTDILEAGAPVPAPGKPVYYLAVSMGYRDFGTPMGGEKIPEARGVLAMVTKILDSQGYKVASEEHLPDLVILYSWGTFYRNPNPGMQRRSERAMLEFLGGHKVGLYTDARSNAFPELNPGLTPLHPDTSTMAGFLPHGIYVITFWASDYGMATQGRSRIYWKTNIAASTRGFYLPEVLPTMVAVAAPLIGRETARPIRIDVGKHYRPTVELGPLKVIEEDVKTDGRK